MSLPADATEGRTTASQAGLFDCTVTAQGKDGATESMTRRIRVAKVDGAATQQPAAEEAAAEPAATEPAAAEPIATQVEQVSLAGAPAAAARLPAMPAGTPS